MNVASVKSSSITAVDIFCGAGGLTYGLGRAGINVVAGIDVDEACRLPYESNNVGKFLQRDIRTTCSSEIKDLFDGARLTMLAGCAPCQPFSTYTQGQKRRTKDWSLLDEFTRLVKELRPDFVTMENVPGVARHQVYKRFVQTLVDLKYSYVVDESLDCRLFGIPQRRRRLVLLASLRGELSLPQPTHSLKNCRTVREVIGNLEPIKAGSQSREDPLHAAAGMTTLNLRRIRASIPGGTWRDWPKNLVAKCHKKKAGRKYSGVYGRMEWDEPSPTITTLCHGFGNGRFGHPAQDRALTLREAALLQTFPKQYRFVESASDVSFTVLGRLIGNAVPVRLGEVIGRALVTHAKLSGKGA